MTVETKRQLSRRTVYYQPVRLPGGRIWSEETYLNTLRVHLIVFFYLGPI